MARGVQELREEEQLVQLCCGITSPVAAENSLQFIAQHRITPDFPFFPPSFPFCHSSPAGSAGAGSSCRRSGSEDTQHSQQVHPSAEREARKFGAGSCSRLQQLRRSFLVGFLPSPALDPAHKYPQSPPFDILIFF